MSSKRSWFGVLAVGLLASAAWGQTDIVQLGTEPNDVCTLNGAPYRYEDIADYRTEHVWATNEHGYPYDRKFKGVMNVDSYGNYDMANADNPEGLSFVEIEYQLVGNSFIGQLTARALKPNFAYQVKLIGKPSKRFAGGDDATNYILGSLGRWWRSDWIGGEWVSQGNTTDTDYYTYLDDPDVCIEGYLMFDFFVTDKEGNADLPLNLDSSFHVLWKTSQTGEAAPGYTAGKLISHTVVARPGEYWGRSAYKKAYPTQTVEVYGEPEWYDRPAPGQVQLPEGTYNCRLMLTEETFHANWDDWNFVQHADLPGGFWQGAAIGDVSFTVGTPEPLTDVAIESVDAPASAVPDTLVPVDVTVANVGNQDVTNNLAVTLVDGVATVGTQTITGGLLAGQSVVVPFTWNTTGASLGDHLLLASHDLTDQNAANDSASTTVNVQQPGGDVHVGDLDGSATRKKKNWSATVTVTIHDAGEAVMDGATVYGVWSTGGSANGTTVGGQVSFTQGGIKNNHSSVDFTVTDVVPTSGGYDPSSNHDPDGDSNGTVIVIDKP